MGLFKPKKADDTYAEEKESGHGALDFSGLEKEREFVAGMSDPDIGAGGAPKGDLGRTMFRPFLRKKACRQPEYCRLAGCPAGTGPKDRHIPVRER